MNDQQPISIDIDILRDKLGQHEVNELMAASMLKQQAEQLKNQKQTIVELEAKVPKDATQEAPAPAPVLNGAAG